VAIRVHAALELALKADALRTKQYRRTARALFVEIKNQGYTGSSSRVTAFIREWRGTAGKAPHAFVPLSFALGEAFQFDWSTEGLPLDARLGTPQAYAPLLGAQHAGVPLAGVAALEFFKQGDGVEPGVGLQQRDDFTVPNRTQWVGSGAPIAPRSL